MTTAGFMATFLALAALATSASASLSLDEKESVPGSSAGSPPALPARFYPWVNRWPADQIEAELAKRAGTRNPYSWMNVNGRFKRSRSRNPYSWMADLDDEISFQPAKKSRNPYSWMAEPKRNPYSWMNFV